MRVPVLRRTGLLSLALIGAVSATAMAQPPRLDDITPSGLQRGAEGTLVVQGLFLGSNPRLIAPGLLPNVITGEAGSDGKSCTFKLTPSPDVALGVHLVRVQTDNGVSRPFPLEVGQLPQANEAEPNQDPAHAQEVKAPVVVEGRTPGNDVDCFRFSGRKGQRIIADARCSRLGSGLDPQLRLTTAGGRLIATADDSPGLQTDALIVAELPEDGDYIVEISDTKYAGGRRPAYRLVLGETPLATSIYPLGGRRGEAIGFELQGGTLPRTALAAAMAPSQGEDRIRPTWPLQVLGLAGPSDPGLLVELLPRLETSNLPELREPAEGENAPLRVIAPVVLNGRIEAPDDEDTFRLVVKPQTTIRVRTLAAALGSPLDALLRVLKTDGGELARSDDTPWRLPVLPGANGPELTSPDPSLEFAVPEGVGEIDLAIRAVDGGGGPGHAYRLVVEQVAPGFRLQLLASELSVPRGGTAALAVVAVRQGGYNGPITLELPNIPPGVTLRAATIPAGQTATAITLTAAEDAAFDLTTLQVLGKGAVEGGLLEASGRCEIVTNEQAGVALATAQLDGLVVAPATRAAVTLTAPGDRIEVAHGGSAKVRLELARNDEGKVEVIVSPLTFSAGGLSSPEVKVPADKTEAELVVSAAPEAPLGAVDVAFRGRAKIQDVDRSFDAPLVGLEVVRPVVLEPASATAELKPTAKLELKGKLVRKGGYAGPATVRLDKLPAGVKAEPVTVAADQSEFTLVIAAEEGAADAAVTAELVAAIKIGDKDYSVPPLPIALKVAK